MEKLEGLIKVYAGLVNNNLQKEKRGIDATETGLEMMEGRT